MIYVDTYEYKSGIPDELEELGAEVEKSPMPAGDYMTRNALIERKQTGDYVGRLQTNENDIFVQMLKCKEAAEDQDLRPVLALTGDWNSATAWSNTPMPLIIGSLAGVWKMGVDVVAFPDDKSFARFLNTIETESTGDIGTIRDTPSVPESQYHIYLTQGFDRIGEKGAQKLLNHFGSFREIVNASEEELKEVDGVGESTAAKIVKHVTMEYEE